jgi:hypothetical protein
MNPEELRIAIPVLWPSVAIALAFMLIAWWPFRKPAKRTEPVGNAHWASAAAIGLAFIASFLVILNGWPGSQPKQSWQWLLNIGAASTIAGIAASFFPSFTARSAIALLLACVVAWLFHTPRMIENQLLWKVGVGGATFIAWMAFEPLAQRRAGLSIPLAMMIVFGGASFLIKESRAANLSLASASCSAAWGAVALVTLFNAQLKVLRGAMYVVAALWPALFALGEFERRGGVRQISFIILVLAPLMLWIAELAVFRKLKHWQMIALRAGLVAFPIAISIGLAMNAAAEDAYDS